MNEENNLINEPLDTFVNRTSNLISQRSEMGFSSKTWKRKGFKILLIILRFINLITRSNFASSFKLMKHHTFRIINDAASSYSYYKYNGFFKYDKPSDFMKKLYFKFKFFYGTFYIFYLTLKDIRQNFIKKKQNQFLVKPDDTGIIIWNIYLLIIVSINVIYISLRLSFSEIVEGQSLLEIILFEQIPGYSYLLEIPLKFNTCIYSRGNLIANRKRIALNYINDQFLLDFLIVVPFFIGYQINFRWLDLAIIMKALQLSKLTNSLFNRLELNPRQTALFDLTKLILFIILAAHFIACAWHAIGQYGYWGDTTITWLKDNSFEGQSWPERYVVSFYWSIVTMTTIGYGDITPVNTTERLFVIFVTFVSTFFLSYSVNSIGSILTDLSKQQAYFKTNMNSLRKFLKSQNISHDLEIKFRRYFEYLWSKPPQEEFQYHHLIPEDLQKEMIIDVNMNVAKKLKFFNQFSKQLLHKLCMNLKDRQLQSEEYLLKKKDIPDILYILVHGELKSSVELSKKKLKEIEKFNKIRLIGGFEFFTNQQYRYDIKATKSTKLLMITRDHLIEIFQEFPKDYEILLQFQEQMKYQDNYDYLGVYCEACGRFSHSLIDCTMVTGFPNKSKVMLNHKRNLPSDRIKFDRSKFKRRQKNNAWINYQENFECVLQLVLDNYEELSHVQMDGFRDYIHSQIQLQKGLSNSLIPKNTIKYLTFTQQYTSKWNDKQLEIPNIVIKGPRRQSLMSNVQIKEELKIEEEIPTQTNDPHSQVDNLSIQVQQDLPQKNTIQDIPLKLSINDIPQPRASNKVIHLIGPQASTPIRSPIKRQTLKKLFDDEEEQEQQIMGQYLDIFYNFEKQKEFINFFSKYNLSNILNELSFQQTFQPDQKLKQKRQKSLMVLLNQQKTRRSKTTKQNF